MDKLTKNKNVSKGKGKENRHLNLLKTSVKKFIKKEDKKMKKSEGSIEKEKVKVIINSINKKLNEFKKKPNYRED